MPAGFTASLSKRLNSKSALRVKEAQEGDTSKGRNCTCSSWKLSYGNCAEKILNGREKEVVHLSCGPKELGSRPSVNAPFQICCLIYGPKIISLILTGMNCDGADGAEEVKKWEGKVIAEARSSCVIYGMPGEIVRRKLADFVLPLDEMAEKIIKIIVLNCLIRNFLAENHSKKEKSKSKGRENYGYVKIYGHFQGRV